MITIINTFKEKLTKTFVPSIFYSLLPLALICLYFYIYSFAPFFTPITHQSSLYASPPFRKVSIINEKLNGEDGNHTSFGANFTEEDPISIIKKKLKGGDGHQTSSDGNFTKEDPISIINEILNGGDGHPTSSDGNFTEEDTILIIKKKLNGGEGHQTSSGGNFMKEDPIAIINEKLNGGDGYHTSSNGNFMEEDTISIIKKKLNGGDGNQTSLGGNFPKEDPKKEKPHEKSCDYLNGNWVHDKRGPLYNGTTCNEIKKSQNCIVNGRPDSRYLYWRWKPSECDLPIFEPNTFLKLINNKNIVFVGDSLARNQIESLVCLLSTASKPKRVHHIGSDAKWYFPSHNANLTAYWSPFLVKGDQRQKDGPHYNTIYLDHVNEMWARDIDQMDLIVLSFGHWFLDVPSIYYEGDSIIGCFRCREFKLNYNDIGFYVPMRKALRTTLNSIIERKMVKGNGIDVIVRTFSPTHFEGAWDKGGTCSKNEPYKNEEKKLEGMDAKIRSIEIEEAENAMAKSKQFGLNLKVLDITKLALLRPDGHAGAYMNPFPFSKRVPKYVQNDCVHWCLPGPIDTWNEILLEMMKKEKNY